MIYCLVPRELGRRLHSSLERHFRDDPSIVVLTDQRNSERRRDGDRREAPLAVWAIDSTDPGERRRVRHAAGRRVDERRAVMVASPEDRELPRMARRHAAALSFAVPIEPPQRAVDDADSARLAIRAQSGDPKAFEAIYMRYFDPVYAYLRMALQSVHDVEEGLQAVFTRALGELPEHRVDSMAFSVWIGSLLYGHAPDKTDTVVRIEDQGGPAATDALELLDWLTDDDLRMLMERLPALSREVMGLCYILDLSAREIGTITGLPTDEIERLHDRSIRFMGRCVASLGKRPGYSGRHPITAPPRPEIVMRRRRLALAGGS